MKRPLKFLSIILVSSFIIACSSDDDSSISQQGTTTVNASDFTATLDENSPTDTEIGNVIGTSNNGAVTFSIASQSVNNALQIDAATGELLVDDASAFDFETNPVLTAIVTVVNGSASKNVDVTINLNDMDDFLNILSTSLADYENASNGDWLVITETEYDALASKLNQVTIAGVNNSLFNVNVATSGGADGFTIANKENDTETEMTLLEDEYVFAFKYINKAEETSTRIDDQVKITSNSNIANGYVDLGTKLPSHSGQGIKYFIIKGNTIKNSSDGHLAFSSSNRSGYTNIGSGYALQYANGNASTLNSVTHEFIYHFQALTTTQKQW